MVVVVLGGELQTVMDISAVVVALAASVATTMTWAPLGSGRDTGDHPVRAVGGQARAGTLRTTEPQRSPLAGHLGQAFAEFRLWDGGR